MINTDYHLLRTPFKFFTYVLGLKKWRKTLKHALGKNWSYLSVFCFIDDNFFNFIYTKTVKNSKLFIATMLYQDIFYKKKNFFSEKGRKV